MIVLSFPKNATEFERETAKAFVADRLEALGPVYTALDGGRSVGEIRGSKGLVYWPLETGGVDAHQARDLLEARLYGKKIWAVNRNSQGAKRWLSLNGNSSRTIPPFLTVEETRRLNQTEVADA